MPWGKILAVVFYLISLLLTHGCTAARRDGEIESLRAKIRSSRCTGGDDARPHIFREEAAGAASAPAVGTPGPAENPAVGTNRTVNVGPRLLQHDQGW